LRTEFSKGTDEYVITRENPLALTNWMASAINRSNKYLLPEEGGCLEVPDDSVVFVCQGANSK